jgi:hypothetical protein
MTTTKMKTAMMMTAMMTECRLCDPARSEDADDGAGVARVTVVIPAIIILATGD